MLMSSPTSVSCRCHCLRHRSFSTWLVLLYGWDLQAVSLRTFPTVIDLDPEYEVGFLSNQIRESSIQDVTNRFLPWCLVENWLHPSLTTNKAGFVFLLQPHKPPPKRKKKKSPAHNSTCILINSILHCLKKVVIFGHKNICMKNDSNLGPCVVL